MLHTATACWGCRATPEAAQEAETQETEAPQTFLYNSHGKGGARRFAAGVLLSGYLQQPEVDHLGLTHLHRGGENDGDWADFTPSQ